MFKFGNSYQGFNVCNNRVHLFLFCSPVQV
jgi:hypothetical protein